MVLLEQQGTQVQESRKTASFLLEIEITVIESTQNLNHIRQDSSLNRLMNDLNIVRVILQEGRDMNNQKRSNFCHFESTNVHRNNDAQNSVYSHKERLSSKPEKTQLKVKHFYYY